MVGSYKLQEHQEMVRAMARDMAKNKLAPRAAQIDRTGEFPWDIINFYRENRI
jgi:alkylation response protein AidB-like acyl-CoA dehydrogenase